MDFLREKLLVEYEAGNYVIVGGDWNQCPPNIQADVFMKGKANEDAYDQLSIAEDFMSKDWHWAYDVSVPTNRKAAEVYDPEETFVTLIDFFLVSPNVEILNVQGVDQAFAFSDHQPVKLRVKIK